MISSKKLLRNSFFLTAIIALYFFGCNQEPEVKKYIARVNNSYLTEENISDLDSLFKQGFSRNELVKKWIEKELLYQEAVKLGITDRDDFNRIINDSRRELASTMLINSHLESMLKEPGNSELQDYFNLHKSEFKTEENLYVFNLASFANENTAIKFRTKLIESSWEKVIENYAEDKSLIDYKTSYAVSRLEIYPLQLLNLIEELNAGEVSIVLEQKTDKYSVIQLLQIFRSGADPPFEIIRDEVESRYIADKKERMFDEFIEQLYSNNEIEIKEN